VDANPYTTLMVAALREAGLRVALVPPRKYLPLWDLVAGRVRADLVHLQWQHGYFTGRNALFGALNSLLFFSQCLLLRTRGVRFVWTVHNLVNHERRQAAWEVKAGRLLARLVDAVIAQSPSAATEVAAAYRLPIGAVTLVPHAAYPVPRAPEPGDTPRRDPSTGCALLCFGSIRPYKGVPDLIRAFAVIDHETARLTIVGQPHSPALERELRAAAEHDARIRLVLERVEDRELARHLRECDVAVLPYTAVLTSGAAIMAASAGRGLIVPRLGSLADIPADAAIHYESADPRGLETALRQALRMDAEARAAMGRAASSYAHQTSWPRVAERLARIYRDVLARGRGESGDG
ncbi:MAG: glycosyltransferase, partial [Longimicrobiales bacterium]